MEKKEEEHNNNSDESFEENKNCEKNESLFGLTGGKICENCKYFEKLTLPGQSVRRCHACARKKNSLEKKNSHEEFEKEESFEIDYNFQDDPTTIPSSKCVAEMDTNLQENLSDFTVELEPVDSIGGNACKGQNFINYEDGKFMFKKKEGFLPFKREYKSLSLSDVTSRKEKSACLKGRLLLDNTMAKENNDQTIETIDSQKTKEEIELEKRERGWNVHGSIIGKSFNHSKASPMKSVVTIDGYSPGKDQRDKTKFKSLKEKPDTQRILGLVAKRNESRLSSPTHRAPNPNYKKNEEVETQYTSNIGYSIVSSISQYEGNSYTFKSQKVPDEITKENEIGSNHDGFKIKSFHTNIQDVQQSKFLKSQDESKPKCLSPTNLSCYSNENILFGTQRILELLAKRNGSLETTLPSSVDFGNSKMKYEEDLLRPNSNGLKFPTPPSTICHVNDNPLYGAKFESEPNCNTHNTNDNCLHILKPNSNSPFVTHSHVGKPLKYETNEALDTNPSEKYSNLILRSSSIHSSKGITPLYKLAITTPRCKSPDPTKEINMKNTIKIEFGSHPRELEIVEECQLVPKTRRIEELLIENLDKNDRRFKNENEKDNERTLEASQIMNHTGSSNDILDKDCCNEKIMSNCNSKAKSWRNIFKCHYFLWPLQIIFGIFSFPFKLVLRFISFIFLLFRVFWGGIGKVFNKLKNLTVMGIDFIRSKILEISRKRCNSTNGYSSCGCASKTYFLIVLSSLLLPSLFDFDFYLINRFIEGQVIIREALNFDYTKEHPSAIINLLPQQIMGKAKGYFPDKEVMTAHAFPPDYIFHMIVHLTLPESQYNQEIGMFQVSIETFSARGHSLIKASRASMLRYHSSPIKYMKSVFMGIPIVLGLCQESQTLSIRLIESQGENEHSPTATVNVEIEPKVGHSIGLGVPEIYYAQLQVIAHNPHLREVARNWAWNLYLYSGLALFIFEVLLVFCCSQKVFSQKVVGKRKSEDFLSKNKKLILERGQKFAQVPRRIHRGHNYYSKNLPLALPNISSANDSKSTLNCSTTTIEDFKSIRLANNSIPKSNHDLSF